MDVSSLLHTLRERLPELEWQLNKPGASFSTQSLPPGLFRNREDDPVACVAEIRADINTLFGHPNPRIVRYLIEKINQKINVLVAVCAQRKQHAPESEQAAFVVDQLSTRRQWLETMEATIKRLEEQRQALLHSLTEKDLAGNHPVSLNLRSELGALEQRLTLAQEAYARAIGEAF